MIRVSLFDLWLHLHGGWMHVVDYCNSVIGLSLRLELL